MKAIETRYKGYRFRSRLEARWAVFFDAVGAVWDYEREGFVLPCGAYLPDFWFPAIQRWVEIKPDEPSAEERRKAQELATETQRPVAILIGPAPDVWEPRRWDAPLTSPGPYCCGEMFWPVGVSRNKETDKHATLYLCKTCGLFRVESLSEGDTWCHGCGDRVSPFMNDRITEAVEAARGARFEHGEKPRP